MDELPPNVFIYVIAQRIGFSFFTSYPDLVRHICVIGSHMFSSAIWDKSAPINVSKTALSMSVLKFLHVHY